MARIARAEFSQPGAADDSPLPSVIIERYTSGPNLMLARQVSDGCRDTAASGLLGLINQSGDVQGLHRQAVRGVVDEMGISPQQIAASNPARVEHWSIWQDEGRARRQRAFLRVHHEGGPIKRYFGLGRVVLDGMHMPASEQRQGRGTALAYTALSGFNGKAATSVYVPTGFEAMEGWATSYGYEPTGDPVNTTWNGLRMDVQRYDSHVGDVMDAMRAKRPWLEDARMINDNQLAAISLPPGLRF